MNKSIILKMDLLCYYAPPYLGVFPPGMFHREQNNHFKAESCFLTAGRLLRASPAGRGGTRGGRGAARERRDEVQEGRGEAREGKCEAPEGTGETCEGREGTQSEGPQEQEEKEGELTEAKGTKEQEEVKPGESGVLV